jgi:hypothetical protein
MLSRQEEEEQLTKDKAAFKNYSQELVNNLKQGHKQAKDIINRF